MRGRWAENGRIPVEVIPPECSITTKAKARLGADECKNKEQVHVSAREKSCFQNNYKRPVEDSSSD